MGRQIHGEQVTDIAWFVPDGSLMDDEQLERGHAPRPSRYFLSGEDLGIDQRGQPITDSSFFMMLNAL